MNNESQNTEYKLTWRDEYLKWVCGFANAQGGTIYIGIDDKGNIKGVDNIHRLSEDIPNKIVKNNHKDGYTKQDGNSSPRTDRVERVLVSDCGLPHFVRKLAGPGFPPK